MTTTGNDSNDQPATRDAEEIAQMIWVVHDRIADIDEIWKLFGYKKRRRSGTIFRVFATSQTLAEEDFLLQELSIIGLARAVRLIGDVFEDNLRVTIMARSLELFVDGVKPSESLTGYTYFSKCQ